MHLGINPQTPDIVGLYPGFTAKRAIVVGQQKLIAAKYEKIGIAPEGTFEAVIQRPLQPTQAGDIRGDDFPVAGLIEQIGSDRTPELIPQEAVLETPSPRPVLDRVNAWFQPRKR